MGQRGRAGGLTGRLRTRLEKLEGRVEATRDVLTLPDGSRVLYAQPDALRALGAAIRGGRGTAARPIPGSRDGRGDARALPGPRGEPRRWVGSGGASASWSAR